MDDAQCWWSVWVGRAELLSPTNQDKNTLEPPKNKPSEKHAELIAKFVHIKNMHSQNVRQ